MVVLVVKVEVMIMAAAAVVVGQVRLEMGGYPLVLVLWEDWEHLSVVVTVQI
jgi:hypothetical protein